MHPHLRTVLLTLTLACALGCAKNAESATDSEQAITAKAPSGSTDPGAPPPLRFRCAMRYRGGDGATEFTSSTTSVFGTREDLVFFSASGADDTYAYVLKMFPEPSSAPLRLQFVRPHVPHTLDGPVIAQATSTVPTEPGKEFLVLHTMIPPISLKGDDGAVHEFAALEGTCTSESSST